MRFLVKIYRPFYDEPTAEEKAAADAKAAEAAKAGTASDAGNKTFTQEQVNSIVSDRLKTQRLEQTKLLGQLQDLQKSKSLTEEERGNLASQVENLQSALLTKEELMARQKKELETQLTTEIEQKKKEVQTWQERFTQSTIERALVDSAIKNKAVNPRQIKDLLNNSTRLVEEKDAEGRPTGKFVPFAKVVGQDKDGKPVTLDLPVDEAIAEMKKNVEDYGNLFMSNINGGLGQTTLHSVGGSNVGDLKDTANYIAQRKAGKLTLDGIGDKL